MNSEKARRTMSSLQPLTVRSKLLTRGYEDEEIRGTKEN